MFAKLISSGSLVLGKPIRHCLTGSTPTGDCLYMGGIPYGNCIKGHG